MNDTRTRKRLPRPSANKVTVREVAEAARVSMATVSRVLNGHPGVDAALGRRVREAARRLGYTPNAAARALASQRSRVIGAVVPTLESANFAVGIAALQRRLSAAGYTLLLGSANYDAREERRQVEALVSQGVAAMMLVGARHASALYRRLAARNIPFVNTWVLDDANPCVGFDNVEIGRALAEHMLSLGHRDIAVIAQASGTSDRAAGRVVGVRQALAGHGMAPAQEQLIDDTHNILAGQRALRALMRSSRRPTAVICGTDALAFGALIEAERLGIAVPDALSIAGINDVDYAAHLTPPLTTVRLPADEIGTRAADYLLARLAGEPVAPVTRVAYELIVRGSTAAPRRVQPRAGAPLQPAMRV